MPFHGRLRFSRIKPDFTECVTAVKSWIKLVPNNTLLLCIIVGGHKQTDRQTDREHRAHAVSLVGRVRLETVNQQLRCQFTNADLVYGCEQRKPTDTQSSRHIILTLPCTNVLSQSISSFVFLYHLTDLNEPYKSVMSIFFLILEQ